MSTIKLEGSLDVSSIHRFVNQFIDDERSPRSNEFFVDMCSVKFVTPVGVTSLVNLLTYLGKSGCIIIVQYPDRPTEPVKYLDDCGFFSHFAGKPLRPHAKCRSTTIPLKIVGYAEYDSWLEYSVFPWLSSHLGFDIKREWPSFYAVIGEIFNNINDHAGLDDCIASTIMQYFPKKNEIEIAISDYGIGIPARVRKVLPQLHTDGAAIIKATEDNFSTKSTPRNRGAGLHTIIQNTVEINGGNVTIISGYGAVEFNQIWLKGSPLGSAGGIRYPGTLLRLVLRTDTIQREEFYEEDMSW